MNTEQEDRKCIKCEYYYITWDKRFPYGCKAFGFKSIGLPILEVKKASGEDCKLFKEKQRAR